MRVTYPVAHGNKRSYGNFAENDTSDAERGLCTEWVSYSTTIAFEGNGWPLTTIENYWSNTTARHIVTARQCRSYFGEPWELGPLSADWFETALRAFRLGLSVDQWITIARGHTCEHRLTVESLNADGSSTCGTCYVESYPR